MPNYLIRRLILLGGMSIIGVLFIQSYWLLKTWDIKDKEFDQSVNIVLRKVAQRLAAYNTTVLPKTNLIQRKSSNYYAVNVNGSIDPPILEEYLFQEINNQSLNIDFEYAIYDCFNDALVYGNYCSFENKQSTPTKLNKHYKFDDLVYYFVIRFPKRENFLLANLNITIIFTMFSVLAILFFLYSIWVILKQKRLSELQRDFINNMTHEFKTPIASIKIASDVLANDIKTKEDPRLSRYAQIIREQNSRLNDQVEKVLNIARLEKDSIELKKEWIDLNETLQNIIKAEDVKVTNGTMDWMPGTETVYIYTDKLHFVNVICNILDNAVKYCKNENIKIQVSTHFQKNHLLISCKDNGIGISEEDQKKLFDKFFRVSTGDKHDVKGFGLGLFYVKNICRAHGWWISVDSELGKGTTFTIDIPEFKFKL
ncbi:MAG: HAMP domain-containing histidine kinase [Saprospiraceae bacterium]|nr:HAMP domain-containing histidine kinase [Saprospiraceae bacterium]MBK7524008.1 HAMP domain-containing histidine kinase [Saprospiraceae bacterium]MBK8372061.1 HAMP domain-containing histidine kinase [Saprospiraceae bacterium]MBK8547330.1 HAMP domain-containing histidine kinase [Saprospiraceae bacterium]MBK9042319.1 HAMP domain-containing histidine kinase [Saprospiraceae bacterium]